MAKKKALLGVVCLAMVALIAVFGTVAFLTDRDAETNVFTSGDVAIDLTEDFAQGAQLLPGEKVEKEVAITNTGKNDAWVWYTIAYPKALDLTASDKTILWTGFTTENHDNAGYAGSNDGVDEWLIEYAGAPYLRYYTDDNGVEMVEFTVLYQQALAPGATTPGSLECVYIDKAIDIDPEGNWYRVEKGVAEAINWNSKTSGNPTIYVSAYAIQADTFNTVQEAYTAYQGQWGTNGTEYAPAPTVAEVDTADELVAALTTANVVVLNADIVVEDTTLAIANGSDVTINLNGNKLAGVNTENKTSALINNSGTLKLVGEGLISVLAEHPDTDWDPEGFPAYASNTIANKGTLIIDGVTVENQTAKGGASYVIDNYAGATLTIESGKIVQSGGDVAIRMFSGSATAANNVTINGGEISGKRAVWIQLPSNNSAVAPLTNLTINGGTLSGTQMAIYSYSYGNSFANTNVTITGGTFNGDVQFGGGYKGDKETVTVTGGTFNGSLGRWLVNDGWEDIAKP